MAETKLPLRVRVDIRDRFDSSDCAVQRAFSTLGGTIGLKTQCDVEWEILFRTLGASLEDKGIFVPSIADAVIAWCDVLSTRLEDENFTAWTDELVGKLSEVGIIRLHLQTSEELRPTTTWSDSHRGFFISFPQNVTFSSKNASSGFESDFQDLFMPTSNSTGHEILPVRSKEDEWAEITETSDIASIGVGPVYVEQLAKTQKLPDIATIPSPDVYLKSTIPYILLVTQKGTGKFVESGTTRVFHTGAGGSMNEGSSTMTQQGANNLIIQGTHSASLQFLAQYLQRWVKKDHQDVRKPPLFRIKLHESSFGIGMSYDMLTIEPYDKYQDKHGVMINPAIVLLLIEKVLGYHCISRFNAGNWEFRRDIPFG